MSITKSMAISCIKRELDLSLPIRKKHNASHQRPLWAWIRGSDATCLSKIEAVLGNRSRWPWKTYKAAAEVFFVRIQKNRTMPWIQKNWLSSYLEMNYPGNYRQTFDTALVDFPPSKNFARIISCSRKTEDFFCECFKKCNFDVRKPPLRLILSAEFSVIINLKFMEIYT